MIDPVNEPDVHIGARLLDFFDPRSPWNRRLWNVGLGLTLREVLEAAEAHHSGDLGDRAVSFLANVAQQPWDARTAPEATQGAETGGWRDGV